MNVGAPYGTIMSDCLSRESEMPVVVMITEKVKSEGAKGHYYKQSFKEWKLAGIDSHESEKR